MSTADSEPPPALVSLLRGDPHDSSDEGDCSAFTPDLAAEQAAAWSTLSPAQRTEYQMIMDGLGSDRERVETSLTDLEDLAAGFVKAACEQPEYPGGKERLYSEARGIMLAIKAVRVALAGETPQGAQPESAAPAVTDPARELAAYKFFLASLHSEASNSIWWHTTKGMKPTGYPAYALPAARKLEQDICQFMRDAAYVMETYWEDVNKRGVLELQRNYWRAKAEGNAEAEAQAARALAGRRAAP
jgi:hypothetical protein